MRRRIVAHVAFIEAGAQNVSVFHQYRTDLGFAGRLRAGAPVVCFEVSESWVAIVKLG